MLPSYLLQKVYLKGSLKNNEEGFEFALRNVVQTGTLVGMNPLTVNGVSVPPAMVRIVYDGAEVYGNQVSNRSPVPIPVNVKTRILVKCSPLQPGDHEIGISLVTREVGLIKFKITDTIE